MRDGSLPPLSHPPFTPHILWLLSSSHHGDSSCQSHHSFPSLLNIFSPYSSRLFMTFETVFLLETAAPLALWYVILALLFLPWPLLSTLGAPHPLCLMIITNFFFFYFYWSIVDLQCCVSFRCTA